MNSENQIEYREAPQGSLANLCTITEETQRDVFIAMRGVKLIFSKKVFKMARHRCRPRRSCKWYVPLSVKGNLYLFTQQELNHGQERARMEELIDITEWEKHNLDRPGLFCPPNNSHGWASL